LDRDPKAVVEPVPPLPRERAVERESAPAVTPPANVLVAVVDVAM